MLDTVSRYAEERAEEERAYNAGWAIGNAILDAQEAVSADSALDRLADALSDLSDYGYRHDSRYRDLWLDGFNGGLEDNLTIKQANDLIEWLMDGWIEYQNSSFIDELA